MGRQKSVYLTYLPALKNTMKQWLVEPKVKKVSAEGEKRLIERKAIIRPGLHFRCRASLEIGNVRPASDR